MTTPPLPPKKLDTYFCGPIVRDVIHGDLHLPLYVWEVADTFVMQRLRGLKQAGLCHLVRPSAVHTRYNHSLGVAYLAKELLRELQANSDIPPLEEGICASVILAALLHDIGHGIISHAFDRYMKHVDPTWSHEGQAKVLIRHMFATTPGLEEHLVRDIGVNVDLIITLITNDKEPDAYPGVPKFVHEIVSNKISGMDVDKWDYILRDSLMTQTPVSVNVKRLISTARVVEDHIMWPLSETSNVFQVFESRYKLHLVYSHTICKVAEYMAMEAVRLLGDWEIIPGVPISKAHCHPEAYVLMTDWIVDGGIAGYLPGAVPEAAKIMFKRIALRQFWTLIVNVAWPEDSGCADPDSIVQDIMTFSDGDAITAHDFVVDVAVINCGKGKFNPVERVQFFNEWGVVDPKTVSESSYLRPSGYQARQVRVYSKEPDKFHDVNEAVVSWVRGRKLQMIPVSHQR